MDIKYGLHIMSCVRKIYQFNTLTCDIILTSTSNANKASICSGKLSCAAKWSKVYSSVHDYNSSNNQKWSHK